MTDAEKLEAIKAILDERHRLARQWSFMKPGAHTLLGEVATIVEWQPSGEPEPGHDLIWGPV